MVLLESDVWDGLGGDGGWSDGGVGIGTRRVLGAFVVFSSGARSETCYSRESDKCAFEVGEKTAMGAGSACYMLGCRFPPWGALWRFPWSPV